MKMNMLGANIPWPYNIPNLTTPDGKPGIWTMIGAYEVVQKEMADSVPGTKTPDIYLDCDGAREDQK